MTAKTKAVKGNRADFKCPYCFQDVQPDEVAFRAMTVYARQDFDDMPEEEKMKKEPYIMMAEDELYQKFWSRYPGSMPEDTDKYKFYAKNPVLSKSDERFITNNSFYDGSELLFKEDREGFLNEVIDTEGNSSKIRICPHCHNRLPFEFGKYPIKYIPVVGITSSGKTVYLSQLLNNINEFLSSVGMTVAGLCPEVDEFVRNHAIKRGGTLFTGTSADILTPPIPVNVKNNINGERYTLVFYDIAGENCVNPDKMEKYGPFIRNADGIIMVMDPEQFSDFIHLSDEDIKDIYDPDRVVAAMYNAFISADSLEGKSSVPLAAALSKSDLLKDDKKFGEHQNLFQNIDYKAYPQRGFPCGDCKNTNTTVGFILRRNSKKGQILDDKLKQQFDNYSYFLFSALNGEPEVHEEGGTKRYEVKISPQTIRVEEPLFWILRQLNLIQDATTQPSNGGWFRRRAGG